MTVVVGWSHNDLPDGMEYQLKPHVAKPMLSEMHEEPSHQ